MPKIPQQAASEALTRKPIDSIVPGGVTTLFAVFSMTVCLGLYILVDRHQAEMREASLLRTALAATTNMTKFRSFYSQEVVGRLSGSDVIVTHDYKNQPNAVPLPATMTIEFGKFLESSGGETTTTRIYLTVRWATVPPHRRPFGLCRQAPGLRPCACRHSSQP